MVDDRRPTAQEIEELIDLVRRDPSSPAFIDLGEAYLALGRPKDAISIGNIGIQAAPDSLEGRVMLARAHASLHQWKEAQAELLRVVKVDRSSRQGFALLGEVLLRRSDFERAVPVLQHAQNLDPTSPQILSMLKRARSGQALDAPTPIPTPVPPRGETNYNLSIKDAPSRSAPPRSPPPPRALPLSAPVPYASPAMPTMAMSPAEPESALWGNDPPSLGSPASPVMTSRPNKPTAPPPPANVLDGVRPRVIMASKEKNAAAASLRQSAAVGENYLNDLLTGGLLDVAGVRVPDSDFDLRPDRRWGRSTRRAFIFLFVVLFIGIGGGGGWYWWSEKKKAEEVASLQDEALKSIGNGDFAGLENSVGKLNEAFKLDAGNILSRAYAAQTTGLEALLYGTDAVRVDASIRDVVHIIKEGEKGSRELVIGRAAVELSRLSTLATPATTLAEVTKLLDTYLAKNDTDKWARWLKGRAQLAAGQRKAAAATLKSVAEGDDGLVVAMIDLADLEVDEGNLDDAFKLYDKALAKQKDHPLAVMGKALARAENSIQTTDAIEDLNVKLDKTLGPRVSSYRYLALAMADVGIEDYSHSFEALKKATSSDKKPTEPRFVARVAWALLERGQIDKPFTLLSAFPPSGSKPEDDPNSKLVEAGQLETRGMSSRALDAASKLVGPRAGLLRAHTYIEMNKGKDAQNELDDVLKAAPDNLEAQILAAWAKVLVAADAKNDKDKTAAFDALEKLARKAKTKLGRHALGMAYFQTGDFKNAQPALEQALADITDDEPNPVAYRTRTALATILLANNDAEGAAKQLNDALKANVQFVPAIALKARFEMSQGDGDQALETLAPLLAEADLMTPEAKLTQAEALCNHKKPAPTAADKDNAEKILTDLKDKVQPPTEVGRVAAVCDPKWPEKLGVPVPPADGSKPAPPAGTTHHHHHTSP
ncbi:MAG: tetratricopeptide repeat protein [Kofleriaceae bacterium]